LKVRAVVAGNYPELVAGGFANVELQFGKNDQPLVAPTQAIIPQARDKKVIIYRDGKPEFVTVSTGIRDSSYVQILDGLKLGDTILTTALLAVRPESKISLTKVN
ncbi:MAG: efflux RND transporter periplasmic adaptor subunit, partial [Chitinophagaceae bacterium]|nr:efflux RND transporter periplasmic adaptor subunit [Chitinophagaceae bacterium]